MAAAPNLPKGWTMILLTEEAHALLRAAGATKTLATKRADGQWNVPVENTTVERLLEHQFSGETFSDTIVRLFHTTQRPLQ